LCWTNSFFITSIKDGSFLIFLTREIFRTVKYTWNKIERSELPVRYCEEGLYSVRKSW
jgi:hypothetical protein